MEANKDIVITEQKARRASRPLGFGLVFAGLCFFFNPYVAVIDVLPDFIGALLIYLFYTSEIKNFKKNINLK